MGCFSSSSTRTRPSQVMQPLQKNTVNTSKTATAVLTNNNNFGENAQVIRQLKNVESPKIYRTDQLNLSDEQYKFINSSLSASDYLFMGFIAVHSASNRNPRVFDIKEEIEKAINRYVNDCISAKKDLEEFEYQKNDLNQPLVKKARSRIIHATNFMGNQDKLKALLKNTNAKKFLNRDYFDAESMYRFNNFLMGINLGDTPEDLANIKTEDKLILAHIADIYACKGVIEKQLPKVKQEFSNISGKLDKDFATIIGEAIEFTEISLQNINHPKRAAILEKIAPALRPTVYGENRGPEGLFKNKKAPIAYKTDAETADIFRALKEIPLLLC